MRIHNEFGTVVLDWKSSTNLLLSFSGGADSTLLMYLIMTEMRDKRLDTHLNVITGVTPHKGVFKQFTSQENFDRMRSEFPELKDRISDRVIIYNDTQEELGDYTIQFQLDGKCDLCIFGLTANPPLDVMEKHDLLSKRREDRDPGTHHKEWTEHLGAKQYAPFRNIDKRWIAKCYEDFDLWRFYNNTISCERLRETSDMKFNEDPCGHCWWCREKKMAFGMLDGQYVC